MRGLSLASLAAVSWLSCAGCIPSAGPIGDEWRQVATTSGALEGLRNHRGVLELEWWRSRDGGWSLSSAPLEAAIDALNTNREFVVYGHGEQSRPMWGRVELGAASHVYVYGTDPELRVRVRRFSVANGPIVDFARCGLGADYFSVGGATADGFVGAVTMNTCDGAWVCNGIRLVRFSAEGATAIGCAVTQSTRPLVHPFIDRLLDQTEVHDLDDATPALGSFGETVDGATVAWVPTTKRVAVLVGEPREPAGWAYAYEERELLADGGVVRRPTRFSTEPFGRLVAMKRFPDESIAYVLRVAVLGDKPTESFRYLRELIDGGVLLREVDATGVPSGPYVGPWGDGGVLIAGRPREDGGFSVWAATMP